jgi:hypothetical protein
MSEIISFIAGQRALDGLREERVLKKFKQLKATTPETAVKLEEAGLTKKERERIPSLEKSAKLKKTEDGRYYISCKEKRC